VVVHDLYIVGIPVLPSKADPPLFVDADAVLFTAITPQTLQPVPWCDREILERYGGLK
jgi:hypothetical protein